MHIAFPLPSLRRQQSYTIPLPVSSRTRIASLAECTLQAGDLRSFPTHRWDQLQAFRPNVLIAQATQLEDLAGLVDEGKLELDTLDTAILVATEFGSATITDVQRVVLWQSFGVPIYELLLTPDGQVLAWECEAHEGWHLEEGTSLEKSDGVLTLRVAGRRQPVGMFGRISNVACDCGRERPRIQANTGQRRGACVLAAIA